MLWEWMPRHATERQSAVMDFIRSIGLRPSKWLGENHAKQHQWTYKARNGNTKHLDLQFAGEVIERLPIGEWSQSDHRPVTIRRRGRPRTLVELPQPPVAPLWRWMPTPPRGGCARQAMGQLDTHQRRRCAARAHRGSEGAHPVAIPRSGGRGMPHGRDGHQQ